MTQALKWRVIGSQEETGPLTANLDTVEMLLEITGNRVVSTKTALPSKANMVRRTRTTKPPSGSLRAPTCTATARVLTRHTTSLWSLRWPARDMR